MSKTVQVEIKGLAVCYPCGDLWKVDFLCDSNHQLLFSHNGTGGNPRPLGNRKTIGIEVIDPVNREAKLGKDFKKIFNMVADAHTGGVRLIKPPNMHKVSMLIPHASLGTKTETNKPYGRRDDRPNAPWTKLRKVADTVGVEIELQDSGRIILKVDEEVIDVPSQNNTILTFDNDCRPPGIAPCDRVDDSRLYYELIEGLERPPVRYIFGKIDEDKDGVIRSNPDGNCDPVVIYPPPIPGG